ncbi:hypothetical protein, conserved [Eimeria tenella]|uniref:Uncharacterized protein n=1 Tax=Eimeria tenella TaxID=5802 RepID=U6KQQ4_EIMTE|nr:hypothetical protein, conserved [Eimeria tenella]CDJ37773.1 hypothetical protein, conserved [Eimeria tenella]|eukprot:XP_013228611.1 hypothetical protein, conserved [Eimeria tenella]
MTVLPAEHEAHAPIIQQAELLDPVIQQVNLSDGHVSNSSSTAVLNDGAVPSARSESRRKHNRAPHPLTWLLPAYVLGLFIVVSLCSRIGQNVTGSGLTERRLASRGGAGMDLNADELAALCREVGEWRPDERFYGSGRVSPAIVDKVFESLTGLPPESASMSGMNSSAGLSRGPPESAGGQSVYGQGLVFPSHNISEWGAPAGQQDPLSTPGVGTSSMVAQITIRDVQSDFGQTPTQYSAYSAPPALSSQTHLQPGSQQQPVTYYEAGYGQSQQPAMQAVGPQDLHEQSLLFFPSAAPSKRPPVPVRPPPPTQDTLMARANIASLLDSLAKNPSAWLAGSNPVEQSMGGRETNPIQSGSPSFGEDHSSASSGDSDAGCSGAARDKDSQGGPGERALTTPSGSENAVFDIGEIPQIGSSLFFEHLLTVRNILLKQQISNQDAKELVTCAAALINHARIRLTRTLDYQKPSRALESLGRRFLVFDALHAISKGLGSNTHWQRWCSQLAAVVPIDYAYKVSAVLSMKAIKYLELAKEISAALHKYKSGEAPSAEEVARIKDELLGAEESPVYFRAAKWKVLCSYSNS